jgi:two-component system sensor histidine kinase DegS
MENVDIKTLDKIIKQTIAAVRDSRGQIFDVYEMARDELENVKRDLERVKKETADVIFRVDELERSERRSRIHLMEVSREFRLHSEEKIKDAYEKARLLQVDLAVARQQEQALRKQRDDLEIRVRNLGGTVEKAEKLVSQVGVVLDYLSDQMTTVFQNMENLQNAQIMGAQIIKSQEDERRRVARDIHDGPAQSIANIVFRAEVCERLIDNDTERAKAELRELREHIRHTLGDIRKIIFDLRPMAIDDLGLVPAIRGILEHIRNTDKLEADIHVTGEEKRLDSHIEIGLFRVIQEALNNVLKHAQAKAVRVRVDFAAEVVHVVVEDDGKGFDMPLDEVPSGHFGLMGMRERMLLLGGTVNVKSEPGRGAKMLFKVPIKAI